MPNTATTLVGFEQQTDWIQPSNTGDTGGGSTKPNGTFVMTSATLEIPAVAAVPSSPATFSAQGNYPYNNGYWYRVIPGAWDAMTYFCYQLQFMLPTAADLAASQAIEFELQQNVGGHIYNMAWQADIAGTKVWRTFDYNTSQWIATNIPVSITPGEWNAIEAVFLRGEAGTMTHVSLSLNGITHPVNITKTATPRVESDYVHCAFQLDSGSTAAPYTCKVQGVNIVMMPSGS